MPRIDGVSLSSTVCRMRRSPSPFTTASWLRLNPTGLLRKVTFTVPLPFESVLSLAMVFSSLAPGFISYFAPGPNFLYGAGPHPTLRRGPREIRQLLAAHPREQRRIFQRSEAGERRAHHVVRVCRPERLRQNIRDPRRLDDGAHRTARDDAGAIRRGLQQHAAGAEVADDRVRDGRSLQRHADQILLRRLDGLFYGRRHLLRLSDAEADDAAAVSHHDKGAEAEVLAALDHLSDSIDRDDGVFDVELRRI